MAESIHITLVVLFFFKMCIGGRFIDEMSFDTLLSTSILAIVMISALSLITISCLNRNTIRRIAEPAVIKPKAMASRRHSGVTFYYTVGILPVYSEYTGSIQPVLRPKKRI